MDHPSPQSRPQHQPVTGEDERAGPPRSASKTWMIWVGIAVVLLAAVVSVLSLLLAPEEIPGAKDAIYFTKTPPHLPLVSASPQAWSDRSMMAFTNEVTSGTALKPLGKLNDYSTTLTCMRGTTETLFVGNEPAPISLMRMEGEKLTSATASVFTAPGLRCELVAVAVYRRSVNRPLGDGLQPLAGVYALDGTRLSTDSLAAEGVAPEWLASEAWLANNDQTRLRWLWKVEARQPLRVAAVAMWDAAREWPLARNWEAEERAHWLAIDQVPTLTASRRVRLIHNLVLLSTETLQMDAAPGAQCASSHARLTLLAAATGPMRMYILPTSVLFPPGMMPGPGMMPDPGMMFGTSTGILLPLDDPPELGSPDCRPITRLRPLPAHPIHSHTLMFALQPRWAGSAADVSAVNPSGEVQAELGKLTDVRWKTPDLGIDDATYFFRAYGDGLTSVTKLRVRLPERYLRLDIELPSIPGLPELAKGDLLQQRIAQVQFADDNALNGYSWLYGFCMMTPRNVGGKAIYPTVFKSATLGEMLLLQESHWLVGTRNARIQFGMSCGVATYQIYEPHQLMDVVKERTAKNLDRYLRK